MSKQHKINEVKEVMNQMLGNFTSFGNIKIPTIFILDNEEPQGALNVFLVDSKEEAEEISMGIVHNKNIIDKVDDYTKPLYLTVLINVPL